MNSSVYANDYATSSIRDWLNRDFYTTAFSSAEQALIAATPLDNRAWSTSYSQYDSASTTDKIFLLSYRDMRNTAYGFSSSYENYDVARRASGTDYAKSQGVSVETSCTTADGKATSHWWLRSPGRESYYVSSVRYDGWVVYYYSVSHTHGGVRPAFKFKSGILESSNLITMEPAASKQLAPARNTVNAAVLTSQPASLPFVWTSSAAETGTTYAVKNAVAGDDYILYAVKNENAADLLAAENLLYVDQLRAESDVLNFSVAPKDGEKNYRVVVKHAELLRYDAVPEYIPGDVSGDGKVTAEDARLALRAAVGLESYAEGSPEFLAADATGDGKVTAEDARLILRRAVGFVDAEFAA